MKTKDVAEIFKVSRKTVWKWVKRVKHRGREWNFFRADSPNELWQMDIKGPFRILKFKIWCKSNDIDVIYAPPYYPQAKGKVERCIRTFVEEYLSLQKVLSRRFLSTECYRCYLTLQQRRSIHNL